MALLERVSTLIRANLNDLIDKAENPEVMLKQVIQDMENQLMQIKTQVAIAAADQHVLERKRQESLDQHTQWVKRAELAVDKQDDGLARAALERSVSAKQLAENFAQQVEDQKAQVANLKTALFKLDQKLAEARAKCDVLIAQHRRSRAINRAADAQMAAGGPSKVAAFERMKGKVLHEDAVSQAKSELVADDVEDRFAALEKGDRIEQLLSDLKSRRTGS
jgi:phage shock protein A